MGDRKLRIAMLCGKGQSSRIMYHGIASDADVVCVILENKPSVVHFLRRRMNNLGIKRVIGQVLFQLFTIVLTRMSQARVRQLLDQYQLDDTPFPTHMLKKVDSVNTDETIKLLSDSAPDAIVVNGTRIINNNVLSSIDAPFINTHMGITPRYRGVHGGYWALANDDKENCGVTVHLVDEGIDTGGVLYQTTIEPEDQDNFVTYPYHQIGTALPLMRAALVAVHKNLINVKPGVPPTQLWYHPTIFEYFRNWRKCGVK